MLTMKEKFQEVKKLLTLVQSTNQALDAENKISLALRLMAEIESSMLSNPYLQDEDLAGVVQFNRGPLWSNARQHLKSLRRTA